jgi:hypothetical protein
MTKEQTLDVLATYEAHLHKLGYEPARADAAEPPIGRVDRASVLCNHVLWMIGEMRTFIAEGRDDKVNRWLGFVQGVLWTTGLYTIDDMREHNTSKPHEESP